MSIIVAEKLTAFPDGEWVPAAPRVIREKLRNDPWSLALWLEAQSKPEGWAMGDRDQMASEIGWPVYRIRRAITGLRLAGLYLVERIQDAAGRWSTACRFVASLVASPQVTPKADSPKVGDPAGIPPVRESKRERHALRLPRLARPHDPATCPREAAGKPCRDCAAAAAERRPEKSSAATHPAPAPVAAVIAAALGATGTECEHGHLPGRCGQCRYRAARG
jgi:hypothetical protein